jgi:protein-tyrosine-phosphatase
VRGSASACNGLHSAIIKAADVVITMGCGDACPIHPGKRHEDWELDDPAGQPVEVVRGIRDELDARVRRLLAELQTVNRAGGDQQGQ